MIKLVPTIDSYDLNLIMKETNCYYQRWFELSKFEDARDNEYFVFELDEQLDDFDIEWMKYFEKEGNEEMVHDCEDTIKIREYLRDKVNGNVILVYTY